MIYQAVSLHYQDSRSDKVYHIEIEEVTPSLYHVFFAYGRRGAKLQGGPKTASPVSLSKASSVYYDLLNSKKAKGYQEVSTQPIPDYIKTSISKAVPSGPAQAPLVHLKYYKKQTISVTANLYEQKELCCQLAVKGQRVLLNIKTRQVTAINENNESVSLSKEIVSELSQLPDCQLEGVLAGGKIVFNDIMVHSNKSLMDMGYQGRYFILEGTVGHLNKRFVDIAETAWDDRPKYNLQCQAKFEKRACIYKKRNAVYHDSGDLICRVE